MSDQSRTTTVWVDLLLLVVALIWGTSYGVVKAALLVYPVLGLVALRFAITFVLLSPSLLALRRLRRGELLAIGLSGLLLLGIFLAETFGLQLSTASNAAFLISLCLVLTPLVEWLWLGLAPRTVELVAAGVSLLGAFLVGGGRLTLSPGDALILLAALLRAVNSCAAKRALRAAHVPTLTLTAVQAGIVSGGCALLAVVIGHDQWRALPSFGAHAGFWGSVAYLVAGCTLFAFFVQNYAVRRSSATRVALLTGSEPVFGALFACLWLGEHLSVEAWVGGALIVGASLLATLWRSPAPVAPRTAAMAALAE